MPNNAPSEAQILKTLNLGGLITDWGGFEKLVAELNTTGDVTVEHDVKLIGKSGASRQIDVLIRHQKGLIEHLVVIDCKHWKSRVGRSEVDALANTVREVNASRGVLFSVAGFESGAVTQARADGIELFKVRELTDEEWGLPGRHVDFFLQVIAKAIANFSAPESTGIGVTEPVMLNLQIGPDKTVQTPIEPHAGTTATTMEQLVEAIAQKAATDACKVQLLFEGALGKRLMRKQVAASFKEPVIIPRPRGGRLFVSKMEFDLGISIAQSRIQIDRGAKYAFVLAIEDEIRGKTRTASRRVGETSTILEPGNIEQPTKERPLENGSVLAFWLGSFFDFSEVAGLEKNEVRDSIG